MVVVGVVPVSSGKSGTQSSVVVVADPGLVSDGLMSEVDGVVDRVRVVVVVVDIWVVGASSVAGGGGWPGSIELRDVCTTAKTKTMITASAPAPASIGLLLPLGRRLATGSDDGVSAGTGSPMGS